jgi:hypothetical protein
LSAPLGVRVYAVPTALSTDGPDLGGNDFTLLHAPRVAMVAGPGISSGGFGGLWQMMDQRLHLGCSFLQLAGLGSTDLRKYTVLVLPPSGDAQSMLGVLGKGGVAKLRAWVDAGGTLIGVGGASTFLADTAAGLSTVRMRSQALKELDLYARATDLALKAENPVIDSVALWSGRQVVDTMKSARTPANEKDLALTDARGKLFMPRGALLRVDLDKEHWLSFGAGDQLAAVMFTSSIFLAREPVRTPARFSGPTDLRLSGLLWPEARDLWARSAYATRESKGKGQIILFAGEPTFRGYFPGTERLLINAILLGPGWGTEQF